MTDQRERNTEKSEMRVMWIMTAVIVLIILGLDEYAHSPRLDARSVAAEVTQQANDAGRTASLQRLWIQGCLDWIPVPLITPPPFLAAPPTALAPLPGRIMRVPLMLAGGTVVPTAEIRAVP